MNFSQAFDAAKEGKFISRSGWKNANIKVAVQSPDEHSANTLPYLYMMKKVDNGDTGRNDRFPLDLSCESLFAEDWEVVE